MGFHFPLETLAVPNDGSRLQAKTVVAPAELEPHPAHPLEQLLPVGFASPEYLSSEARSGEAAEEQKLVPLPVQMVALTQKMVT